MLYFNCYFDFSDGPTLIDIPNDGTSEHNDSIKDLSGSVQSSDSEFY